MPALIFACSPAFSRASYLDRSTPWSPSHHTMSLRRAESIESPPFLKKTMPGDAWTSAVDDYGKDGSDSPVPFTVDGVVAPTDRPEVVQRALEARYVERATGERQIRVALTASFAHRHIQLSRF